LHTGIAAEVAVLRDLLRGTAEDVKKMTENKSPQIGTDKK
jgi:hypothetical protein